MPSVSSPEPHRRLRTLRRKPRSAAFSLVELLVVVAIIGTLLGLLLPAIQSARESSRRSACLNNMRQLAVALHGYEAQNGAFPPGARLGVRNREDGPSWNVLVLPFLELPELYAQATPDRLGDPWSNQPALINVPLFACPSDFRYSEFGTIGFKYPTNYCGVSGAGKSGAVRSLEQQFCGDEFLDGILVVDLEIPFESISDGASNTILFGERNRGIHVWTRGAEWVNGPDARRCLFSTKNVAWPINADPKLFPESGEPLQSNFLNFGSYHQGGAHMARADGAAEFLRDTIDLSVYRALASRNGGELVSGE